MCMHVTGRALEQGKVALATHNYMSTLVYYHAAIFSHTKLLPVATTQCRNGVMGAELQLIALTQYCTNRLIVLH